MPDDLNQPTPPPPHPPQPSPPPPAWAQPTAGYQPPRPAYPYTPQFAGPHATPYATPGFYPPRKPRSAWFWPVIILGTILILGLMFSAIVWSVIHSGDDGGTPAFRASRIAVIDVTGVILDADKI